MALTNADVEGKKAASGNVGLVSGKSVDSGKVASVSGNDGASQRCANLRYIFSSLKFCRHWFNFLLFFFVVADS